MTSYFKSLSLVAGLLLTAVAASAAAPVSSASPAPEANAKTPAELLLEEIKQTPYAERATLRARLTVAETRLNDRLPEWEARKNSLPEKERLAAEADFVQLKRSRETLRQKIDGVDMASEETWNSAKTDLYTVLLDAVQTWKKLRARFLG